MKVIQVMTKNITDELDINMGTVSKLVSVLSALKWKSFNFTTKLYVDKFYKDYFDSIGLINLYDEVDCTYFTDSDPYAAKNIDKRFFWAMSKLFVLENEKEPFILSDMDFIPLKDFHSFTEQCEVFGYYKEQYRNSITYPDKEHMPVGEGYEFPEWLTWSVNPINTAVLYIQNEGLKKSYLEEAFRYAANNTIDTDDLEVINKNTFVPRMTFAEQRLLAECANHLNIDIVEIKNKYELVFNPREIHLFLFKQIDQDGHDPFNWIMFFLHKLHDEFKDVFDKIIELEEFARYKEVIEEDGFKYKTPRMLQKTNW